MVGGDYFDLVELEQGRTAFVIADVAGKGLAAALLTAMLQGGFSGIALAQDPIQLISNFNEYVWARSDSNRYATVFLGSLDEEGKIEVVNAGQQPALLIRGDQVLSLFESDCFPIGMFPEVEFRSQTSKLERGDTLILFTDGINEAVNAQGEEFGLERISEVALANADASVGNLQASILEAVTQFSRGAEQADDMTLLILRYTGIK